MTFWITKYALTKGILKVDGCTVRVASPEVTYAVKRDQNLFCRIGADAFETEAEAIQNAYQRAQRKRKVLEKSVTKVNDLTLKWGNAYFNMTGNEPKTKS